MCFQLGTYQAYLRSLVFLSARMRLEPLRYALCGKPVSDHVPPAFVKTRSVLYQPDLLLDGIMKITPYYLEFIREPALSALNSLNGDEFFVPTVGFEPTHNNVLNVAPLPLGYAGVFQGQESNLRHSVLQTDALPTELPWNDERSEYVAKIGVLFRGSDGFEPST